MSIIPTQTQAEQDIARKNQLVLQAAAATHQLAFQLKQISEQFWSLPTARLLAVLNADVAGTLAIFAANNKLAVDLNANLDALQSDRFPVRAPENMGRSDIEFDGTEFALIPPPVVEAPPVTEPAPEPTPEETP